MPLADNFGRQAEALPIRELLGPTTRFAIDGDNERVVIGRTGATPEVGAIAPKDMLYHPVTIQSAVSGQGNALNPTENNSNSNIDRPVRVFVFDRELVVERVWITATTTSATSFSMDIHVGTRNSNTTNSVFNNATTVGNQITLGASSTIVSSGATSFNGSGTFTVSTSQYISFFMPTIAHTGIQLYLQGRMKST